ncbi:hypothetical protein Ade02nite_20960 [Paractinoplanes deccanensis]|uniref:Uncharacterized protein n=1 Tax=Paractinoplanes deccanensis TaxID=113561 RepID=A0ABQ3Y0S7_9ACTN|nr:hypothetical protein [Actinoplanes deccanensis]GID73455.1 hypothetical protein Ade02nite_20960 [Actinoplanes deccanensis]
MSSGYDDLDSVLQRLARQSIIDHAMQPGGIDAWAQVDRKIPGEHGWVIIPREDASGYAPGAQVLHDATIVEAERLLRGNRTLAELKCTPEFIGQVDAVLGAGDARITDFDPKLAADIVQIGLFGSIWYA